jgi:peptide/nickel transport system permease protein
VLGVLSAFFRRLHLAGVDLFARGGYGPLTADAGQWALHQVLPWITPAVAMMATYVRLTRSRFVEVLDEDFIRTAQAKGRRR